MDLQNLETGERESWISFHEFAYKDDLKHAEKNLIGFPRWSIISGYYAMHDLAKAYIGKIHNKRIVGEKIHSKVIEALKILMQNKEEKEKLIELLERAEITFFNAMRLKEKIIPLMLRAGKEERGKAQYYSTKPDLKDFDSQRAAFFLKNIVEPFIKIMERMICS